MKRLICWWKGCRPDYEAAPEPGGSVVPCGRCGAWDTTYDDRVGINRQKAVIDWLRYWQYGRWFPPRCSCGRRGEHEETSECLPF